MNAHVLVPAEVLGRGVLNGLEQGKGLSKSECVFTVISRGTAGCGPAGLTGQLPQLISFPPRSSPWELVHGFGSNTSVEKGFLWVLSGDGLWE